jgi:hypothetical protein
MSFREKIRLYIKTELEQAVQLEAQGNAYVAKTSLA